MSDLTDKDLKGPPTPSSFDLRERYYAWLNCPKPNKDNGKKVARDNIQNSFKTFGRSQQLKTEEKWLEFIKDVNLNKNKGTQNLEEIGKIWVWSDLHLFHESISKNAGRPFYTTQEMNDTLLRNAKEKVGVTDWLLFLGDLSFGSEEQTTHWLRQCPGRKMIVLGNHDLENSKPEYKKVWAQFEGIADCLSISLETPVKSKNWGEIRQLWLTHYPFFHSWIPKHTFNLHGHMHQHNFDGPRLNLSVEQISYSPVLFKDCLELI